MSGHVPGLMLSLLASQKSIKDLVEDAIIALDRLVNPKNGDDMERLESAVLQECSLVMLKIQQGNQTELEILHMAIKMSQIADTAHKLHKKEFPEDSAEKETKVKIIPMGKHGEA